MFEYYPLLEKTIEDCDICSEVRSVLVEDLNDCYSTLNELREDIYHVSVPKKKCSSKNTLFSEKIIALLYSTMVSFCRTDKVKGIPLAKNFIENVRETLNNTIQLHHFHGTGEIIGYSHSYCNHKGRENYFKVLVVAHNLFRFDFFFLLKGLRTAVWRTKDIKIGGKYLTYMNFSIIAN